ncbi:hypothetical protein BH18VER2_BH18VER2_04160 [soil metagenome]
MDGEDVGKERSAFSELEPRLPTEDDLVLLCRRLNEIGAQYVVVGGFAIIRAGYPRPTGDIDLVIATDLENETLVYRALEVFPDKAVRELKPGEVADYVVVRVADEVVVDLMHSASGIDYAEAAKDVIVREVQGVPIPFASPRLLWRMKAYTHREKDAADLIFLREYFEQIGEKPPER